MTPTLSEALAARLSRVRRAGDFAAFGERSLPVFPLRVTPLGLVGLPLTGEVAGRLYAAGSPAPYGRGEHTLHDPTVRSCRQIPAGDVDLSDGRWGATIEALLAEIGPGLGVEGEVDAHLYKLLVYAPGDFFREHRDTEKEPGMFGTLVVSLPCEHQGGELVLSHAGRTLSGRLGGEDLGVAHWAAFYADCAHELRPVTDGWRVVLVFNLVRAGGRPAPPDSGPEVAALAGLLGRLSREPHPMVALPLEYHYSMAELAFDRLKGVDAARGQVALAAARAAGVELGVAVLEILEVWSDESGWWGRGSTEWEEEEEEEEGEEDEEDEEDGEDDREDDEEDDGDDGEGLHTRGYALLSIRGPTGEAWPLPRLGLFPGELGGRPRLRREKPDATRLVEATGNEGATREKLYRRAALVFVHPDRTGEAVSRYGFDPLRQHVEALAAQPATRGRAPVVLDRAARSLIAGGTLPYGRNPESRLLALVTLLAAHGLDERIGEVVDGPAGAGAPWREAGVLPRWLAVVPAAWHPRLLVRALAACRPAEVAGVLAAVEGAVGRGKELPTVPLAEAVRARLCAPTRGLGAEAFATQPRPLVAVLRFLARFGTVEQRDQAASWLLEHLGDRPVEKVLLPAMEELARSGKLDPAWEPLRAVALGALYSRTAARPRPPEDETRDSSRLGCTCAHCRELAAFLQHPTRRELQLQAHGTVRKHLEEQVGFARLDLDRRTLATRPTHTLVLTKNTASFRALRDRWREDVARIVALGGEEPAAD